MNPFARFLVMFTCLFCLLQPVQASPFPLVSAKVKVVILYDSKASPTDSVAAHLLAEDIERVTSYRPTVLTEIAKAKGTVIVIGEIRSALVQKFTARSPSLLKALEGKWECYAYRQLELPLPGVQRALVVAGSDARGTAFGVFGLSEKIGVSPWYWWADVPVSRQKVLSVTLKDTISSEPSVRYRGIFINDEDWGLRPWAAENFEKEKGNIGPRTYAKVFELLLRLRANFIWPAMHPGTEPFFQDERNAQVAAAYSIVVGSSHAEPMLRNNVGEWDKGWGAFNYNTNAARVLQYWEERVKQSRNNEVLYTLGMRGIHDSGMEGVKSVKEAIPLLERIFVDQRALLERYGQKKGGQVPQAFVTYKEVLDIYDNGLKLPDDVTLIWPDDNYGYIQRLNTGEEKKRSGGSGVYYHASYWGRPHDYLWLGTTHPALIREEMMKAYEHGADRVWVLNVGDIKPLEYSMQLFMDMAYRAELFRKPAYVQQHLQQWLGKAFGKEKAAGLASIMRSYYDLAFERRPEFMGWSQTEPTTQVGMTAYDHFAWGDEGEKRVGKYEKLEREVRTLRTLMGPQAAAFFQLVYYPVVGSSMMNKKYLFRDKALLYSRQGRFSARDYAARSRAAYDSIVKETIFYNQYLLNGKWQGMMAMKPRELPVFDEPKTAAVEIRKAPWGVLPEGGDTSLMNPVNLQLPGFTAGVEQRHFIDLYLCDSVALPWKAIAEQDWIRLSARKGILRPLSGSSQVRLWVEPVKGSVFSDSLTYGVIRIVMGSDTVRVKIQVQASPGATESFVESAGYLSVHAQHFTSQRKGLNSHWKVVQGLGHTGAALVSSAPVRAVVDSSVIRKEAAYVGYRFRSFSRSAPTLTIYALPFHPLHKGTGVRYAVSIDDGPLQVVDLKTVGRSEEWKRNVLSNTAVRSLSLGPLEPGSHEVKIYALDPGVVLDRILVRFDKKKLPYGVVEETRKK